MVLIYFFIPKKQVQIDRHESIGTDLFVSFMIVKLYIQKPYISH